MPDTFLVQFDKDDKELLSAIKTSFGSDAELLQVKNFDASLHEVCQVALPMIPGALSFLLRYFAKRESTIASKRVVITKDGDISLQGYNEHEVEALLT